MPQQLSDVEFLPAAYDGRGFKPVMSVREMQERQRLCTQAALAQLHSRSRRHRTAPNRLALVTAVPVMLAFVVMLICGLTAFLRTPAELASTAGVNNTTLSSRVRSSHSQALQPWTVSTW